MLSYAALLMVVSMVTAQEAKAATMPAELRKQIDERMIGQVTYEATWGDKKFKGQETIRWAGRKTGTANDTTRLKTIHTRLPEGRLQFDEPEAVMEQFANWVMEVGGGRTMTGPSTGHRVRFLTYRHEPITWSSNARDGLTSMRGGSTSQEYVRSGRG